MICLVYSFVTGQNPANLKKPKAIIALRFFSHFGSDFEET